VTAKRIRLAQFLVAAMIVLGLSAVPVLAADEAAPGYGDDTLTGDWNGLRSDWYRRGLALDLAYKWDMLRVASGGLQQGGRPIGHFDLRTRGDLEKLFGWKGATAFVNFIYDGGGKTNRDHLGSLLGISNVEVPVSTTRFYQAWVEQSFAEGELTVLAGLYPIDTEFQAVESAGLFVQPPYGAAPDLALTRGPSIFNNPAFGVRAKWLLNDRGLYAMGAVLDGIPGDPDRPKGTHIRFQRGDGSMQIAEIGYRPPEKESFEKYAAGFWRYSAKANDLADLDANGNPELRRSSGWYALAERTLWRWSTGDLTGFVRFGATDGDSTAIEEFYNVGAHVRGLLPGREDDVFGLAYTRAGTGEKFRASQAAAGIPATAAESATEITYRVQISKWLAVQPLIQRFRHPGATRAVPNATVVGARMELAL
jgi:porin